MQIVLDDLGKTMADIALKHFFNQPNFWRIGPAPTVLPNNPNQTNTMAILRSTDGKFYEVADEQLQDKLIAGEELKSKLSGAATGQAPEVKKRRRSDSARLLLASELLPQLLESQLLPQLPPALSRNFPNRSPLSAQRAQGRRFWGFRTNLIESMIQPCWIENLK